MQLQTRLIFDAHQDISFTATGHYALLRLAYRFESKELLNTENQLDPFYRDKTDI
jgi:hypothetical protein